MRSMLAFAVVFVFTGISFSKEPEKSKASKVEIGSQAPDFKIKDASGKEIILSELTSKGPVLVSLTWMCRL